jgi:4-hydroxy 2-oxovalerate aldolase
MSKIINLDCSFRDGGYHNNWIFDQKDINLYLHHISKTNIKYIEIGFRLINKKNSGPTAYTSDQFLEKLNINKDIKIGIMINAADFILNNKVIYQRLKKVFPSFNYLSFIRIAFHNKDVRNVAKIAKYLSKNNLEIILNLMQISELNNQQILKSLKIINKLELKTFYIADSFGSLKPSYISNISKLLNRHCKFDLGFHAHDNLKLAFTNTKMAIKNNFTYIDSTMMGMGRGAGNLKTEEIYKFLNKNDKVGIQNLNKIKDKIFKPLKKKYKWGTNIYYNFAAKNSIHPSYVQELLRNKNYLSKDYFKILKSLLNTDSKSYNQDYLNLDKNFKTNKNIHKSIKDNENFLIVGSAKNLIKYKDKVINFSLSLNLTNIAVNTNKVFDNNFIDYRVACHPSRIKMDYSFYKKFNNKFVIPVNNIDKFFFATLNKDQILNFDLIVNKKNPENIKVNLNQCILPNKLVIGYAIAFAIANGAKKIYLAGFEGFDNDNPANDESEHVLQLFNNKYKKVKISSITPTKLNIKYERII